MGMSAISWRHESGWCALRARDFDGLTNMASWCIEMTVASTRVFVSFDYEGDKGLKGSLVSQGKASKSGVRFVDFSLRKSSSVEWLPRAQSAIAKCDVFIVLLGNNTHQSPGVLKEVEIAKGLRKRRFQLKPQGTNPKPVDGGGPVVNWTRKKLEKCLV